MTSLPILSSKLGLKNENESHYSGFIDKIELNVSPSHVHIKTLLSDISLDIEDAKVSRCYAVSLFTEKLQSCVKALYRRDGFVYKLIINPSSISSWSIFLKETKDMWKYFDIESDIVRIDLTVDIRHPFNKVVQGLLVTGKSSLTVFWKSSLTGLNFGRGDEVIKVYNKKLKARYNFDCTRIEIALQGKKRPFKKLKEMENYFMNLSYSNNPFNIFTLNDIYLNRDIEMTKPNVRKITELNILLATFPLQVFKKVLNVNNNFSKKYRHFLQITPNHIQPDFIFKQGISNFFSLNQ